MKRLAALLTSLTMTLLLAGCSSSSSSSTSGGSSSTSTTAAAVPSTTTSSASCPSSAAGFAKTKFVAHAGLAFGAFHRYIYKPYQAGTFKSGASGRLRAFIKAGAAALFVKREVRLAYGAAQQSPALCKTIVGPLKKIGDTVSGAVSRLKSGDVSGVGAIDGAINLVKNKASSQGSAINEPSNVSI